MQNVNECIEIIRRGRPSVSIGEATVWAEYLQQLKGCHLFSAASPDVDYKGWLRQRRAGIGGSEIAAIMGENHWNSPHQIWMSKMGMFDDKKPTQSEAARWGNLLETTVATEWGLRTGRQWIHIPCIIQSDNEPWLLANIDGFTLTDDRALITGILEIKTTSAYNLQVWEEGPLPFHYLCQTNWYCGITGLEMYDIACLVGGQKLCFHTLPFDQELFMRECQVARDFWCEYVLKGIEPALTDVDKRLIQEANEPHDESLPPVIIERDEDERVITAYCELRDKISQLDKVKKALYAQIYSMLGNGTQIVSREHTVVLGSSARRTCNFDALEELFPEAYKECVATNVYTIMRVK